MVAFHGWPMICKTTKPPTFVLAGGHSLTPLRIRSFNHGQPSATFSRHTRSNSSPCSHFSVHDNHVQRPHFTKLLVDATTRDGMSGSPVYHRFSGVGWRLDLGR
jgi:hypothetical protein